MTAKIFKPLLLVIAGAVIALAFDRATPPASAQGSVLCGTPASPRPCELTGYKLLSNKNQPNLLILQMETRQGPRLFVASRKTVERFARELLGRVEALDGEKL